MRLPIYSASTTPVSMSEVEDVVENSHLFPSTTESGLISESEVSVT